MPWGAPDVEPMLCVACFRSGTPFLQRRRLARAPKLVAWVRCCPPCYAAGWRLVGGEIDAGRWWDRRYARAGLGEGAA